MQGLIPIGGQMPVVGIGEEVPSTPSVTITGIDDLAPKGDKKKEKSSALGNILSNWWQQVDPRPFVKELLTHPDPAALTADLSSQMGEEVAKHYTEAKDAFDKGDYTTAVNRAVAMIPLIGPGIAKSANQLRDKDYSGAAGTALGVATPFMAGDVAGGALGVVDRATPGVATVLDRSAVHRFVRSVAPTSGPNKVRFGNMAAKAAPDMLRDPGMAAWSTMGLEGKVQTALEAAQADLNAEYASIPNTRMFPKAPLKKALQTSLDDLSVKGEQVKVGAGGTTTSPTSMEPDTRASRADALRQAITELDGVGHQLNADNLRKLAQSWGDGAKAIYTPDTAADYLKIRGSGAGYADAEQAVRGYLNNNITTLAPKNARYSLIKSVSDVMKAADEANRVKPNAARQIGGALAGGAIGEMIGGPQAAAIGAVITPILDATYTSGATAQIGVARSLTRMADALRSGKTARAQMHALAAAKTAGITLPKSALAAFILGDEDKE